MSLFLQRLKEVGICTLAIVIFLVFITIIGFILHFIPVIVGQIIAGIIVLLLVGTAVVSFIYWLFIEPFRKK